MHSVVILIWEGGHGHMTSAEGRFSRKRILDDGAELTCFKSVTVKRGKGVLVPLQISCVIGPLINSVVKLDSCKTCIDSLLS